MNTLGHRQFRGSAVVSSLCVALSVAMYAAMPTAQAQVVAQAEAVRAYEIPAGPLAAALSAWGAQSGQQLVFAPELVEGRTARAVSGRYAAQEALTRLLQGTHLGWELTPDSTYVLKRVVETNPTSQVKTQEHEEADRPTEMPVQDMRALSVTGTRIRGGSTPSPVISISAENIQQEGFNDLGEVIRSVPQNFSGGQNPGVLMGNVIGAGVHNQNLTGGSALNLRGLGPDASLTLLNGRRMAYSGFSQAVDISAIPVEAVERVEIVADGASAIYGSDAIGGVANVILRRGFDGFAVGASYGAAMGGGQATREYTATAGNAWASGGFIATFKDVSTDPIYARQRKYTAHLSEPQMLLPSNDLRSGLLSAYQALGNRVELRLDALRTEREQLFHFYGTNPALYNILTPETTTTLISPSMVSFLGDDWTISIAGTWGKDEFIENQSRFTFATGAVTPLVFGCYCNRSRSYEIGAEGTLFEVRGGDARLAIGAGYRENEITLPSYLASGAGTPRGEESSRFAYAEIYLPLFGSASTTGAAQRFDLTAAIRGEDYDSFGKVSTPKLGLIYSPSADFTLKTSWGKSFKAPTLLQMLRPHAVQVRLASAVGAVGHPENALVLASFGGNPGLEPERARIWTTSLAIHPQSIPGFEAEIAWFDIDYTDRVVEPIPNILQAMSNPAYAEFIQLNPSDADQAALIASDYDGVILNSTGFPYDPSSIVAIVQGRYINAVRQRIKGLDLSGSYGLNLAAGRLTMRGSASWLDSAQQSTTTVFDLSGTLHNPAKLSSRLGAVWSQGGFTASAFANYKSGVTNVVEAEKLASFTTVDVALRYTAQQQGGVWSGFEAALSMQNLLDRSPSLYTLPAGRQFVPGYDSTNYSPIGRFMSLSVSKRW